MKYFSGIITYTTTFKWNATDSQSRFYLDLGQAEVMAQVKLNGRDLGIVWKPPYEMDVTDVLAPWAQHIGGPSGQSLAEPSNRG